MTSAVGLLVLTPMVCLGLHSLLSGTYRMPAVLFLLFLACCAAVIAYCATAEVSLSAEGISQKTLLSRWQFRWKEIENWTVRSNPNDSDDLLFKVDSLPRMLEVSGAAVNEKEMPEVKRWFQEFVGDAIRYDDFMARSERSGR